MEYRNDRKQEPVSVLGFGCMRLSKRGRSIDLEKAEKEIMEAFRLGVNYYDTAYIYPGNEAALGEILERTGIRDQINIATKLPHYLVSSSAGIRKMFEEELKRLRTTWIDYYLMHFLTDVSQWEKLKRIGVREWIEEEKTAGRIRNIGFSFHGNTESFLKILNDYDWDFCMIQYNYLDEVAQAGRDGLQAAAEKGISVFIMEPLRGGKLTDLLPEQALRAIRNSSTGYTPAELAFRWLWDQPEITCVLSGMNSIEMIRENCRIASDAAVGTFPEEGKRLVAEVREAVIRSTRVGCTECGYCMPCPAHVDIPGNFRSYNRLYLEKKRSGYKDFFQAMVLADPPGFASQCVGCGKCEQHCPQHIRIRKELKKADRALRPLPFKVGFALARKIMLRKRAVSTEAEK